MEIVDYKGEKLVFSKEHIDSLKKKRNGIEISHKEKERKVVGDEENKIVNGIREIVSSLKHVNDINELHNGINLVDDMLKQLLVENLSQSDSTKITEPSSQRSWVEKISDSQPLTLILPDPETGDYERWANRSDKTEKPLAFLDRVWGKYIEAGLMGQTELAGQKKTSTNQTPRKGLDQTLFNVVWKQCKDDGLNLNDYLPSKSKKIDRELESLDLPKSTRLVALALASSRRSSK